MNIELLRNIGLTDSEIKVYLALLELGSTTRGPIVKKSKVASSKVYELLEKLMQKGLVSYVIKSGIKYFEASDPDRLLDYMNQKEESFVQQKKQLESMIPELKLKKELSEFKSEATIFKGMKGLETAFKDIVKVCKKGDIVKEYVIGNVDEKMRIFCTKYHNLLSSHGIKTQAIFSEEGKQHYKEHKKTKYFEGKITDAKLSPSTITVYKDNINLRMGSSKDAICLVIHNKDLAASFSEQFDTMWNQKTFTYKGYKEITCFFENLLKEKEVWWIGCNFGMHFYFEKDYWEEYKKRRIKHKQIWHDLIDTGTLDYEDLRKEPFYECKILPEELKDPTVTMIFGNKIANVLWLGKESTIFVIENKKIVESYKQYFNYLWNNVARKPTKLVI